MTFEQFLVRLGRLIAAHRASIPLTQESLSREIGRSTKHLAKIERGLKSISLESLWTVCQVLGISIETLLTAASPTSDETNFEARLKINALLRGASKQKVDLILTIVEKLDDVEL